jgi:hypothetical protein
MKIVSIIFALSCLAACNAAQEFDTSELEFVQAAKLPKVPPASIQSVDVKKAARLYTQTPDGSTRLVKYLYKVERQIAAEKAAERADIAALRAKMARNMAYNQAARAKMKKSLLAKMAVNAKAAKAALDKQMRITQNMFAQQAAVENARNAATIARSKKTREIMRKNKAKAGADLAEAVLHQQRSLSALDQAIQPKIRSTNKHIAANAAMIKSNARKARSALEKAMSRFDDKMRNIHNQALKARSKLVAQANAQDAKFRSYANNRVRTIVASNAAKFRAVRAKMAADRARADAALKHAASRMDAALSANKALQDRRFASTVKDIAAARTEATNRVKRFKSSFKIALLQLTGVVKRQTAKLNKRVTDLSATITHNKLAQDRVNNSVNAELKRMAKIGAQRYAEHLKKDKDLRKLMDKNKAETSAQMTRLRNSFTASLAAINKQMKKDRYNAEHSLKSATQKLYTTLTRNAKAQSKVNKALTMATRRAALNAKQELAAAEAMFGSKLASMHKTVQRLQAKNIRSLHHLTGIVVKNDALDVAGRAKLAAVSKYNHDQLAGSVRQAIAKGEAHAQRVEKKMTKINKATRDQLHAKIALKISKLRKNLNKQIGQLRLETKEARALMRKQVLAAIKSAAAVAKNDLKMKVKWAQGKMATLYRGLSKEQKLGASQRAALRATAANNKKNIINQLGEAIGTQQRALLAFKMETRKKLKKTNRSITANAKQMEANAKAVSAQIKANTNAINAKLNSVRRANMAQLSAVSAAAAKRYSAAIKAVIDGVTKARKNANAMFGKVEVQMAKNRAKLEKSFGSAISDANNRLAALIALSDTRFSKTVKDIKKTKAMARAQNKAARTYFKAKLYELTATLKQQETKLVGARQAVSAMVETEKAAQRKVNMAVDRSIKRIVKIADRRHSESVRARGVLRRIFDQNKKIAAAEIKALRKKAATGLFLARAQAAAHKRKFAKDLTHATKKLNAALFSRSAAQAQKLAGLKAKLTYTKAATAAELKNAKALFASRLTTLTNTVVANAGKFRRHLNRVTGVARSWKKASAADRKAIRAERNGMFADLNKALARAIQLGEARAKKVQEEAQANIKSTQRALTSQIAVQTEFMAENVFKLITGKRQKIADNYLSLKAYAGVAKDAVIDYLSKAGKGRSLSALGDLLTTVGKLFKVKVVPAMGVGFGSRTLPTIFSGRVVKVKGSVSKINALVTEYMKVLAQVRARWPIGLGNYLLGKIETSMQKTGILEVDKVDGRKGNFVFVNGRAVGLSSNPQGLAKLAVRISTYTKALTALTNKLPGHHAAGKATKVGPPQWQGN